MSNLGNLFNKEEKNRLQNGLTEKDLDDIKKEEWYIQNYETELNRRQEEQYNFWRENTEDSYTEFLANEGDEYYSFYWEAYKYKLRTAGPPSILQNTIRFDPDWSINYQTNNSNYIFNNYRVIFYDSDVFLQNCVTNNQSAQNNQRFEGRHGQGIYPLVQKTRYEAGNNETMLEADDFRLIVNNTSTVYYKFKRDDYTSVNHRVLLYRNGQGTASIIQNNTNGSEITGSFTLTAGIYTVDFQKFDGSWQQPTVNNMRALATSEEP